MNYDKYSDKRTAGRQHITHTKFSLSFRRPEKTPVEVEQIVIACLKANYITENDYIELATGHMLEMLHDHHNSVVLLDVKIHLKKKGGFLKNLLSRARAGARAGALAGDGGDVAGGVENSSGTGFSGSSGTGFSGPSNSTAVRNAADENQSAVRNAVVGRLIAASMFKLFTI